MKGGDPHFLVKTRGPIKSCREPTDNNSLYLEGRESGHGHGAEPQDVVKIPPVFVDTHQAGKQQRQCRRTAWHV